ncbi:transposase [Poseidonocella sp. HB161398]|uniref:transposase n=1 Tax=Poseidonocella sp. HB161398 TaxID=2320855 RepID=UPI00351150DE
MGPLTALAVEAFLPDMAQFTCGRDFAAWLGLVPRQHSSGGKDRLGRVSKAGQIDIRRLMIIGAMTRITGRAGAKVLAESDRPDAGQEAEDAGRHCAGEQDGATDLGHADEGRRLQGSGADRGMTLMS